MMINGMSFKQLYAAIVTILTFLYLFAATFGYIPASSQRFADTIIGFLCGSLLSPLIGFYYGSSEEKH